MLFDDYLDEHFPEEWDTDWPESTVLQDGLDYTMATGGKRLRPLLCLKLCGALGGDREQAVVFARAIELFHNFTLVHDDIMDKDVLRRGEEAVWMKYGLSQGILVGDVLHAQAYRYLIDNQDAFPDDVSAALLQLLSDTDRTVADGQSMDIAFRDERSVSEDEYMTMVRKKTGALLAAALQGAGIIADVDDDTMDRIEAVGNALGPAFQIRDDVIDIVGEKGRTTGNDVREGKCSLIAVKALQELPADERAELVQILDREKEATTDADVDRAIELFHSVDAVDAANRVAEDLVDDAMDELDALSDEYDVEDVREVAAFVVERKF